MKITTDRERGRTSSQGIYTALACILLLGYLGWLLVRGAARQATDEREVGWLKSERGETLRRRTLQVGALFFLIVLLVGLVGTLL